jgi:transketolase
MNDTNLTASLREQTRRLRRHVISIAAAQRCPLGGSMSAAELMAVLYFHYLRLPGSTATPDHFLLSKGHAVHIFHACLAETGQISADELPKSGMSGSRLGGHPTYRAPGVEFATGSLGHALSVGVGIAMAEALDNTGARTVVLMGDGEVQEGTVWEAALCAPRFGLENLIAIVDNNRFQAAGEVERILPIEPLAEKWRAFRWNAIEIDGHDIAAILNALETVPAQQGPTVIIANTVKGKGVPGVEGTARAHYTQLDQAETERALAALEVQS